MSEGKRRDLEEIFPEAEEVVKVFARAKRFTNELLKENERLRYKLLDLEQQKTMDKAGAESSGSQEETAELKRELEEIKARFQKLNGENKEFQERYTEIEQQNENLLNLYVSGYQMHTTLNEESVRSVIKEILLNLLGADVFCVWVVNQQTGNLDLSMKVDEHALLGSETPSLGDEYLKKMARGESIFEAPEGRAGVGAPIVCIPLQLEGRTMGVLAVYKLLEPKTDGIAHLDQELLGLLTMQSAAALIGSMVVSRVLPKLRSLGGDSAAA